MVQVRFNFNHPFRGKVLLRKADGMQPWCNTMQFDSKGKHAFDIPFEFPDDGIYQVILDWEFEGRTFFYKSKIIVKDGGRIAELTYDSNQ